MNTSITQLTASDLERIAGGIAVPAEPTFQDYIDLADAALEITMWRLTRYK